MIKKETYQKEWILSHRARKGLEKINPPLADKMIHALGMVELLASAGMSFVFKGGTSLILLLDAPSRFSIDIDIITEHSREEVELFLQKICFGTPFKRYELNERRSYRGDGVPKAHYSLFYLSEITGKEGHVLLDILFDQHPYPSTLDIPVKSEWLLTDSTVQLIKVPTHEGIAGDKLTAYAPNTTGIPYKMGKELEIVKQLSDVGRLYHHVKDMSIVKKAFDKAVEKEIKYRGDKHKPDDIIEDIINTGLLIAKRERNKEEPHLSNFKEIQMGLLQFKTYQMSSFFRIDDAIVSSAKAALMAKRIRGNHSGPVDLFEKAMKKEDLLIKGQAYDFLNKLPAEALFYWNKTLSL